MHVDTYRVPIFEFIIMQYSLITGLEKAKGKDEAIQNMMNQHLIMQYSLTTGLKRFGKQGEMAVIKELGQFHNMNIFIPLDPAKRTHEVRAAAPNLSQTKKDGKAKARACTDGRKQQETTMEEEAVSPMVSIESVSPLEQSDFCQLFL